MAGEGRGKEPIQCGPLRQLVVLSFILLLTGLGVRSLVLQDSRFGWGMFTHHTRFEIQYHWILEDGTRERYRTKNPPDPKLKLKGRATYLRDGKSRTTRQGIGALRSWLAAYMKDVYASGPDDVVALETRLVYTINRGEEKTEILRYPPNAGGASDAEG